MKATGTWVTGLATLAALVACGGNALKELRKHTYPPDFHYITQKEIHSTMGALAVEVVELESIMKKDGGPAPEDRDTVVAILTRMKQLAEQLKKAPRSNHPRIDRYQPLLEADIEEALTAVEAWTPPNYYQAGRVVGACTYCHAPRHEQHVEGIVE